jgi:pyruvate dehydrogenase E2 component (dihydrolipoamide acetyltransferase)
MPTKVHMEALSPTMEEGQLVRWLKQEGDAVSEGDVLAEIETDKATMELVARGSGVLQGIRVREGQTAPVGEVIAVIAAEGEAVESSDAPEARPAAAAQATEAKAPEAKATEAKAPEAQATEAKATEAKAPDAKTTEAKAPEAQQRAAAPEPRAARGREQTASIGETEKPRETEQEQGRLREARAERAGGGGEGAARGGAEQTTARGERAGSRAAAEEAAPRGERAARAPAQEPTPRGDGNGGRIRASPLAKKMAHEAGVELSTVEGSGPGGRITRRDIEAAVKDAGAAPAAEPVAARAPAAAQAPAATAPPVAARAGADTGAEAGARALEVPVSQMRKTIAKRLAQSIGPIPTFYLTIEVDMTRMMELRERVNQKLEKDGIKASLNDFVIKSVAAALARHPEVNSSWGDSVIVRHSRVHIGVAVAVEDGLITPIVRDADRKRVRDIAVEVKELAGRAREKKLKPEEYTGATFSISNLGMFGIVEFTAIINPPESGIIAVGAAEQKVVVVDGTWVVQPRMRLTMSCDHRVVDGATGARFLQTVREMIEDPINIIA